MIYVPSLKSSQSGRFFLIAMVSTLPIYLEKDQTWERWVGTNGDHNVNVQGMWNRGGDSYHII